MKLPALPMPFDAEKLTTLLEELVDNIRRIADELTVANQARQHRDHVHVDTNVLVKPEAKTIDVSQIHDAVATDDDTATPIQLRTRRFR